MYSVRFIVHRHSPIQWKSTVYVLVAQGFAFRECYSLIFARASDYIDLIDLDLKCAAPTLLKHITYIHTYKARGILWNFTEKHV